MTIEADIVTALAAVAGGRVFPEAAPEKYALPMVIYVADGHEPLMTLGGFEGTTKSTFTFECYGNTKAEALTTAVAVKAAIDAALTTTLKTGFRLPVSKDAYESTTMEFMEPVSYSFWHTA